MRGITAFSVAWFAMASAAMIPAAAGATSGDGEREWSFRVFLDDREIGYHDFRVTPTPEGRRLDSEARFDVRFLFVNAFKYRHESHETWSGNCLAEIDAQTRANSDRNAVAGKDLGDRFALRRVTFDRRVEESRREDRIESAPADTVEADCVSTFAYWDRSFLERERLLNPQTGELVPVEVSRLGTETLTLDGIDTPVERFRIATPDGEIEVCYARVGDGWEWVSLESPIDGRTLRYVRQGTRLPRLLSAVDVEAAAGGGAAAGSAP
jgi:hypothetical protein